MSESNFYLWLVKQQKRSDTVGALAVGLLSDTIYPKDADTLVSVKNYLSKRGAPNHIWVALDNAFKEFNPDRLSLADFAKILGVKMQPWQENILNHYAEGIKGSPYPPGHSKSKHKCTHSIAGTYNSNCYWCNN